MEEPRKNCAPAAFLEKLYDIMEDVSLESYISWQPDGQSFLIKDVHSVTEFVLPHYFKHNNIQSFVRQLNMYNFTKTRHDSNYREFRQPLFQRGRRDMLSLIKRKSQVSSEKSAAVKRKFLLNEIEIESKCESRYPLISNDEGSMETEKFSCDGEDENNEESSSHSSHSSDNGISEKYVRRNKERELEGIKSHMSNIESQLWFLNERYTTLQSSYAYLREKFEYFESSYSPPGNSTNQVSENEECISNHNSCIRSGSEPSPTPQSHISCTLNGTRSGIIDKQTSSIPLVRMISMDQKNNYAAEIFPLTDITTSHPIALTTSGEDFARTHKRRKSLSELLGKCNEEVERSRGRTMDETSSPSSSQGPGLGLDAMVVAATLLSAKSVPKALPLPSLRSSLKDLIDAASCRSALNV